MLNSALNVSYLDQHQALSSPTMTLTLLQVFFCVMTSAFSIGHAFPNLQDYAVARGAAFTIFGIIDQV